MKTTGKKSTKRKNGKSTAQATPKQLGYYFDQTRCTGCYTCAVACKDWHDIPAGSTKWLRVATVLKGKFPNLFLAFNANICYQCESAPCIMACPTQAISKREEEGIVVVDREKCLGKDRCGHSCSYECPAGNDVLGFISLIKEGKYAEAWRLLVENNPFPGVCGRVCFHPCESACNRAQIDEVISIHALERFAGEYKSNVSLDAIKRKKQRVAIVGSGPAGLSCAYHLTRFGYEVIVFEALPVAGGMLRMAIPEYRLPKSVVEREIAFIESAGVEIRTNMQLGKNLGFEELDKFDAVFLATGAHKEKRLEIPGIDSNGVIAGLEFLKKAKLNKKIDVGKSVVVLGGGNVAFDCARTARRLGATDIHLVCPECYEDMLASPSEIEQGKEEGIIIHNSCLASRILGNDGHTAGVACFSLRSMEFDENGKLRFEAVKGSEFVLVADTLIVAIGQEPDFSFLPGDIKVRDGMVSIDESGATSRRKYFAGGDMALADRKVARAIGSGRKAAQAIDQYLGNSTEEVESDRPATIESKLIDTSFIEKKQKVKIPLAAMKDRQQNFAEVEQDLNSEQARVEADRCLVCEGMCFVACPYNAPQFGDEENPRMQKCDLCLERWAENVKPVCVESCPTRALDAGFLDELESQYGETKGAAGFSFSQKAKPAIVLKAKLR